jgi:hypothetical protein
MFLCVNLHFINEYHVLNRGLQNIISTLTLDECCTNLLLLMFLLPKRTKSFFFSSMQGNHFKWQHRNCWTSNGKPIFRSVDRIAPPSPARSINGDSAPAVQCYETGVAICGPQTSILKLSTLSRSQVKVTPRPTVSRPVCPGVRPPSGPVTNFSFSFKFSLDSCGFALLWRPLWREDGSVIYCCCWASPAQYLLGLSPMRLKTIFYSPNFWDSPNVEGQVPVFISPRNRVAQLYPRALGSLFIASYDSQGCDGGILTRLLTVITSSAVVTKSRHSRAESKK